MLDPAKRHISQVLFVIGYARDAGIRTKQFEIEKAFVPLVDGAPSVNTNLPDDFSPQMARVTISKGDLSVHFTQITAQLTIRVDNTDGKSLKVIQESIIKKVNLFQSCVDKIVARDSQGERGIVLSLNYPVDRAQYSNTDIFSFIQSRFLRLPELGKPASASASVGFETTDNFFITLSVGHYQVHEAKDIAPSPGQWLDATTWPVTDSGVELKIDINNRPLVGASEQPADATQTVLTKCFDYLSTQANTLMGV